MPTMILPPPSGSSARATNAPRGNGGGTAYPSYAVAASLKNRWKSLKWPITLLVVSILLGTIGSLNILNTGNALSNVKKSSSTSSQAQVSQKMQMQRQPVSSPTITLRPASTPTPAITLTPQNTPGQPIPATTSQPTNTSPSGSTKIVSDTFARNSKNQFNWGTASDGVNRWKIDSDATVLFSTSNHQGVAIGDGYADAVIGPSVKNTMVVVSATMSDYEPMDNGDTTSIGVVLRWQDPNNWYKVFLNGSKLIIRKHVDGQAADLDSMDFTAQPGVSYTIRFRALGSMLSARAWRTGTTEPTTWMVSANDTSFSSGPAGIRLGVQGDIVASISSFTEYRL